VERCRAAPDPEGREDALVDEAERRLGLGGETIVAFALDVLVTTGGVRYTDRRRS
jgi:hypothetical protein